MSMNDACPICADPSCVPPRKDLTLSWANVLHGPGSLKLAYYPPAPGDRDHWISACFGQMNFALACYGGTPQFRMTYFLGGGCPNGAGQACGWPQPDPYTDGTFTPAGCTCSPFHLHLVVDDANCPLLSADGYTDLFIDE